MFSRVPTIVRCCPEVPRRMRATGRFWRVPCASISAVIAANLSMPISITCVPPSFASASKLSALSLFDGSSCPVKNVTCEFWARCVTGIPAYAGAAIADVMPGTTSKSMSAATNVSASSPPRPNTKGSPPLRRITFLPSRAFSTSNALISSCENVFSPGRFPAKMISVSGRAHPSIAGLTSAS